MKILLIAILGTFGSSAFSFSVDGFRSGMTVEELKTYAARQGRDFKTTEGAHGSYRHIIGKFSDYVIDGSFTSCQGIVVDYYRTIDPDIAYANMAEEMLKRYAQPKVAFERLPVHQRPGVYVANLNLIWYAGADRITLGATPEVRDGEGVLIFRRGAAIEYTVRSSCIKDF